MAKPNKIKRDLSGPERWAKIDEITGETPAQNTRSQPGKFGQHDFAKWSDKQKQAYITTVTGIRPEQGKNQSRKYERSQTSGSRYFNANQKKQFITENKQTHTVVK